MAYPTAPSAEAVADFYFARSQLPANDRLRTLPFSPGLACLDSGGSRVDRSVAGRGQHGPAPPGP